MASKKRITVTKTRTSYIKIVVTVPNDDEDEERTHDKWEVEPTADEPAFICVTAPCGQDVFLEPDMATALAQAMLKVVESLEVK